MAFSSEKDAGIGGKRAQRRTSTSLFLATVLLASSFSVTSSFLLHQKSMGGPLLVPSQCVSASTKKNYKKKRKKKTVVGLVPLPHNAADFLLVPSQVPNGNKQHQSRQSTSQLSVSLSQDVSEATATSLHAGANNVLKHPLKTNHPKQTTTNPRTRTVNNNCNRANANQRRNPADTNKKTARRSVGRTRFGNLPDIDWGAISMDHLREHPRFVPLPLPDDLPKMTSLEDARNIRQDSWQWDTLHDGRCTTSQAVAALGFLEDKAGNELGIPSTWHRRGVGAYERLQQPALRTLQEMNDVLIPPNNSNKNTNNNLGKDRNKLWKLPEEEHMIHEEMQTQQQPAKQNKRAFAAKYLHKLSSNERQSRRRRALQYASVGGMGIRMMWGNSQESTSILTALNYFLQQDPNVVMKEVGMCGAGLSLNQTDGASPSSLLIGATPDAVIEHPDGRIEAVEVKNHCPFVVSNTYRRTGTANNQNKKYTVRELPFKKPYIFPLYVPQLMLEMLCLGPKCRSAVMVRQTATSGAMILRIQRDDAWIEEMLYWLQRFQQDFVERQEQPKEDFFYSDPEDGPRYRAFLERTKEIANSVDLVSKVPHRMIQRSHSAESMFLD
ncbi:expressed unknown protein [Seminavis robusta]|uniref:Uncharacterized protein n=1 Tax=Seminavis robusta TaxID=568900 RepID=A0A9N8EM07_9STRA|nr:expressed unknown protein [Seminavis robusta]|eukprot:Sro1514_g278880.1 n/a (609) ;mRNA; f:10161-12098